MKFYKKLLLNTLILLFIFTYLLAAPGVSKSEPFGAILVAHGSINQAWNDENGQVNTLYNNIQNEISPSRLAFLRFVNGSTLTDAIDELKRNNNDLRKVMFVHLSPSSYSVRHQEIGEVASPLLPDNQYQYGVVAMDDHPLIVEILKICADELSEDPQKESLILVGYGATNELENDNWVQQLEDISEKIEEELGEFKEVVCMTLRYHSADKLRSKAVRNFRKTAKRLSKNGKVIVVPYVLCQGSFHEDLKFYIEGIKHAEDIDICRKGVIDNDNTKEWVKKVIDDFKSGGALPEVKSVNRTWSAMDAEIGGNKKHEYGHAEKKVSP